MNSSRFVINMKRFRAAMDRVSYAIEHTIISRTHQTLASFNFYYKHPILEIVGTNGHRIAWQTLAVEGEGQFDIAILCRDMEQALKSMHWASCEVSISEDNKVFFINPDRLSTSIFQDGIPTWPRTEQGLSILHPLVFRNATRAECGFLLKELRLDLAREKSTPPVTYPGLDNHDIAFVSIYNQKLDVSIASPPQNPRAVCIPVQEKLLSSALRFLDLNEPCSARISSMLSGDLMLVLQDSTGGHAIVQCRPVRTVPLGALHTSYCFRVPGSPATFRHVYQMHCELEHGIPSEELLSHRLKSGAFLFSPHLEVFQESVHQAKQRSRNNRPYSSISSLTSIHSSL